MNNIVILSAVNTFTVKGIEMKLKTLDVNVMISSPDSADVSRIRDEAELFVLYMEENLLNMPDDIDYLRDVCLETGKKMVLIGEQAEYDFVKFYIPDDHILDWFRRPLDMNVFLEKVNSYLEEINNEEGKKSVLVVDDDTTYLRVISEWLKDSYRVSMVNSGLQAITRLTKSSVDLILLDYEMPVVTGAKVLQMLRSEPQTRDIPVIFLTGQGDKESVKKVLELKPEGYLLKTIDKKTLLHELEVFFTKQDEVYI